jgi:hypothetical protein
MEMILIDNLDIVMSDRDEVIDYMGHHPDNYLPIIYSYARVREIFGSSAVILLDIQILVGDPDLIIMTVRLPEYIDNVISTLNKIMEESDTCVCRSRGWLLLTTDFHIV